MIWKIIPGYEDYEASDTGLIRRVRADMAPVHKKLPFIVTQRVGSKGYPIVSIWEDGKIRTRKVHRLVALAFHGLPPTPKHEVAHRDGVRTNVTFSNLRWATRKENFEDKIDHGTQKFGVLVEVSVLNDDKVREMRRRRDMGETYQKIADAFEVTYATCWSAVNRKTWAHVV